MRYPRLEHSVRAATWAVQLACVVASACGGDDGSSQERSPTATVPQVGGAAGETASNGAMTPAATPNGPAAVSGSAAQPPAAGAPVNPSMMMTPAAGGTPALNPMMMGGAVPPNQPSTPPGPMDGDPAKPMVSIPGINCGAPRVSFGAPPPTVKIGGRDVFVAYPCKHEAAPVTFFLFLHGTVQEGQKIPFTLGTYSVHELVDSHNLIVVAPQAVGTQWGNGDNGVDLPHLYEVIDWVYATFQEKLDIRSMWAHGGSWGAFYLSTFACDPMLEKRLNGVYMVVGGGCPSCSDRLSCVVIQAELEKGMGMTLAPDKQEMLVDAAKVAPYATKHGCDAKLGPSMLGNARLWNFSNCDEGWYHSYVLHPGEHADKLDQTAVIELTNQMKMTEK